MDSIPLSDLKSNWQFIVFYLIEHIVNENIRYFSISDIIWNVEDIHIVLAIRGHKHKSNNPKNMLYRTLYNMRDKEPPWINFINNRGKYELTDEGYKVLLSIQNEIRYIRKNKAELLKKAATWWDEFE